MNLQFGNSRRGWGALQQRGLGLACAIILVCALPKRALFSSAPLGPEDRGTPVPVPLTLWTPYPLPTPGTPRTPLVAWMFHPWQWTQYRHCRQSSGRTDPLTAGVTRPLLDEKAGLVAWFRPLKRAPTPSVEGRPWWQHQTPEVCSAKRPGWAQPPSREALRRPAI